MADLLQPPPQPKEGLGCCLGKGCLILVIFLAFLATVFVVGGVLGLKTFTSTTPRELPQVATSEEQQQAVLQRWDNFENAVHERRAAPESNETGAQTQTTVPNQPSSNPTIEMTAGDINQIIASNRHSRGKAFVSIENGVGRVAVSIPTPRKARLGQRYLNADFEVRSAPDGEVSGIRISLQGARWLSSLLGGRSLRGWVDPYISQYRSEYDINSFKIVANKVIIEAGHTP
jgi:hypothetical protein